MTADRAAPPRPHHAHITSSVPGRLRVRLKSSEARPEQLEGLRSRLGTKAGVHAVETNMTTGSVTVHYDAEERSLSDVLRMFEDLGMILGTVESGADDLPSGSSKASRNILDAFDDFDRRLSHWTGHQVDLKLLFPLSMGVIGVRQLIVNGIGLAEIPAYVLLWYAFDSFYKLHREHPEVKTTVVRHPGNPRDDDQVHTETRQA